MQRAGLFSPASFLLGLASMATAVAIGAQAPTVDCTGDLLALSPCLPSVSSPPNNESSSPSHSCCRAFSAVVDSSATCFCYLVSQPSLLGFPINTTRLLSLLSLCPHRSANLTADSLQSLCQGSPSLPPLNSLSGNILPEPRSDSGSGFEPFPPPAMGSPPGSGTNSTSPMPMHSTGYRFSPGAFLSLFPFFTIVF